MTSQNSKSSIAVPVRVTTGHAARPAQPPVELPTPSASQPKAVLPKPIGMLKKKKIAAAKKPMPEEQRRKIMWVAVTTATILIIAGWGALFRWQFRTNGNNTIFADLKNLFKNFSISNQLPQSQSSQEIRDLSEQIFPQFQK